MNFAKYAPRYLAAFVWYNGRQFCMKIGFSESHLTKYDGDAGLVGVHGHVVGNYAKNKRYRARHIRD